MSGFDMNQCRAGDVLKIRNGDTIIYLRKVGYESDRPHLCMTHCCNGVFRKEDGKCSKPGLMDYDVVGFE
jgi:hypothetical protein